MAFRIARMIEITGGHIKITFTEQTDGSFTLQATGAVRDGEIAREDAQALARWILSLDHEQ